MAEVRYTQWHGTGTPGMAYGDFSMPPDPAYVQWRALGVSTRAYGDFTRNVDALLADGLTLGAVSLGTPSIAKARYTQLRHGPLPGRLYGEFSGKAASFNSLFAANLSSQAVVFGEVRLGFMPAALSTGDPTVGSPALTQEHSLVATGLATQAVTLGTPTLAGAGEFIADGIDTGSASVPTLTLVQRHSWAVSGLTTGATSLGTVTATVSSNLTANALTTQAADVPEAYLNPPQVPVSYFFLLASAV